MQRPKGLFHLGYNITVAIKGIDGAIETMLGLLIAVAGTQRLAEMILDFIVPELEQHPASRVLQAAHHGATTLSHNSGHFVVTYLLIHGVLKAGIAYNLLLEKRWIFVPAFVVLTGFIAFMGVRLVEHWSAWLLALALFDVITLALVVNEYAALRSSPSRA
ncbi:MAG TPA: DUF2127 domain-containing protein [Rhizomicrobium sp.]|jgi:uncharacterized membrane protein